VTGRAADAPAAAEAAAARPEDDARPTGRRGQYRDARPEHSLNFAAVAKLGTGAAITATGMREPGNPHEQPDSRDIMLRRGDKSVEDSSQPELSNKTSPSRSQEQMLAILDTQNPLPSADGSPSSRGQDPAGGAGPGGN
jgi:hypothetical protein